MATPYEKQAEFVAIFKHRVSGEPRVEKGWAIWDCTQSEQTMARFIGEAHRAGFSSAFARKGKIGVREEDLDSGYVHDFG